MDLSFGRSRKRRTAARVRLDYPRLTAIVASAQAASFTAQVENRLVRDGPDHGTAVEKLVALLASGPGWLGAARSLGGSFHPGVVGPVP